MRRAAVVLAAFVGLLGGPAAVARGGSVELMPGVTYARHVEQLGGKQVIVHVVTAPPPGGLYELVPVLSNGSVLGREQLTAMQKSILTQATVVGVNADYFNFTGDYPSGMFMTGGVLEQPPNRWRSSLGIGQDGVLRIARVAFYGTWAIGATPRASLNELNRPLNKGEVGLFTRAWGPATPTGRQTLDVLVESIDAAMPNVDLPATVVSVKTGGGTPIPPNGAVLQARGAAAARLAALAEPGAPFVVKLILKPWWDGVQDAIGGGPALVQDGRVALPTTEGFTSSQLLPRDPRTAIGQLSDGRIIMVAVDGRSSESAGMTNSDLGAEVRKLGAVTAIALDSGGSTTLAFNGTLLNSPSDGAERRVSDALMLLYYGVYASPPAFPVVSPNGDGVADQARLAWRVVHPSQVQAQLVDGTGTAVWQDSSDVTPGTYRVPESVIDGLREGSWRFVVTATDDDGTVSKAERSFSVNNTLGHLTLSADTLTLSRKHPIDLGVRFRLAHAAQVRVTVATAGGATIRTLLSAKRDPGAIALGWNGRDARGKLVQGGSYRVRTVASNDLGQVTVNASLSIERKR